MEGRLRSGTQTIVLGGGVIGLSVAYELARAGVRVRVLERDRPGCGATGAATVTFTATDDCGNSSTTTATFTIVDEILIEFGQLRQVAYGTLIIVLFLRMRRGVIPTVTSLWRRVRGLESAGAAQSPDPAAGKLEAVSGKSQSAE